MNERDQQLKLLVDFCRKDLASLRNGDWLNLEDDLTKILHFEISKKNTRLSKEKLPEIIAVQKELQRDIAIFVDLLDEKYEAFLHEIVPDKIAFRWWRDPLTGRTHRMVFGGLRDLMLYRLWTLLDFTVNEKIGNCKRCGKLFFKTRKTKMYCDHNCAQQVSNLNKKLGISKKRKRKSKSAPRKVRKHGK